MNFSFKNEALKCISSHILFPHRSQVHLVIVIYNFVTKLELFSVFYYVYTVHQDSQQCGGSGLQRDSFHKCILTSFSGKQKNIDRGF